MSDATVAIVTATVAIAVLFAWHSVSLWRVGRWQMMIDGWLILVTGGSVALSLMFVWDVPFLAAMVVNIIVMGWARDRIRDWRVARGAFMAGYRGRRVTGASK